MAWEKQNGSKSRPFLANMKCQDKIREIHIFTNFKATIVS
jgi:hypothetical protein